MRNSYSPLKNTIELGFVQKLRVTSFVRFQFDCNLLKGRARNGILIAESIVGAWLARQPVLNNLTTHYFTLCVLTETGWLHQDTELLDMVTPD